MNIASTGTPLVIIGAGGHAKVLLSLIWAANLEVLGVCDPVLFAQKNNHWRGIKVLGSDEAISQMDPASVGLVNGIGQLVGGSRRQKIFLDFKKKNFNFPILVHPAAWVDPTAVLGEGVQVMAGAIIQADVKIGANSIINTKASVDHDCKVGFHVHIAPGATLCGDVQVFDRAFIASGSTIIQGLTVGEEAIVGAGAVLTRSLAAKQVVLAAALRNKI